MGEYGRTAETGQNRGLLVPGRKIAYNVYIGNVNQSEFRCLPPAGRRLKEEEGETIATVDVSEYSTD
ncbi:MAG: hypothetical protein ACOX8W_02175 [bacterium]